jgi:hypothetical protein
MSLYSTNRLTYPVETRIVVIVIDIIILIIITCGKDINILINILAKITFEQTEWVNETAFIVRDCKKRGYSHATLRS